MHKSSIGVDISKDALDVHRLADGANVRFTNGPAGWRAFVAWVEKGPIGPILYEPTGPYHRGFERAILAAGLTISKVNPLHARRFAEAIGRLAKTDKIDAEMLAKMGSAIALRPVQGGDEILAQLKEACQARRVLARDLRAERNRA